MPYVTTRRDEAGNPVEAEWREPGVSLSAKPGPALEFGDLDDDPLPLTSAATKPIPEPVLPEPVQKAIHRHARRLAYTALLNERLRVIRTLGLRPDGRDIAPTRKP